MQSGPYVEPPKPDAYDFTQNYSSVVLVKHGDEALGGTGFIIKQDGHILTAKHIIDAITDAPIEIKVHGTNEWQRATLLAVSSFDVALIRVDHPHTVLRPVSLNSGYDFGVGRKAQTLGYRGADSEPSLTDGKIALYCPQQKVWKLEAAVEHGDSGSPVFGLDEGRPVVIGVVSARYPGPSSQGYFTPLYALGDLLLKAGVTLPP
jgi:S1-C subfamily serine protease